jgi:HAD superfamily hydrolase (TIGR01509 family)
VEQGRRDGNGRPALRAVVWDMDGTLIDSTRAVPDAYITAILQRGGPRYSRDEIIAAYSLGPPRLMLSELLGRPASDDDVEEYHARLRANAPGALPYPGIVDTLEALRGRLPLAVFTGAASPGAHILLEASGLLPYFQRVVGGDEVEHQKPAPDGILLACAALGVEPAAAAYVGDSPGDLGAARASGALAVAAGWGHFRAGAPADLVLSSPQELLTVLEEVPGRRRA